MLEYEDLEVALETTLRQAQDDLYRAGVSGVLTTGYELDTSYLPNAWRFSLFHDRELIFASEFVLDKSMTPQISGYEYDCLYFTLASDFIQAMEEHSVIPFITKKYSDQVACYYVRLESIDESE